MVSTLSFFSFLVLFFFFFLSFFYAFSFFFPLFCAPLTFSPLVPISFPFPFLPYWSPLPLPLPLSLTPPIHSADLFQTVSPLTYPSSHRAIEPSITLSNQIQIKSNQTIHFFIFIFYFILVIRGSPFHFHSHFMPNRSSEVFIPRPPRLPTPAAFFMRGKKMWGEERGGEVERQLSGTPLPPSSCCVPPSPHPPYPPTPLRVSHTPNTHPSARLTTRPQHPQHPQHPRHPPTSLPSSAPPPPSQKQPLSNPPYRRRGVGRSPFDVPRSPFPLWPLPPPTPLAPLTLFPPYFRVIVHYDIFLRSLCNPSLPFPFITYIEVRIIKL